LLDKRVLKRGESFKSYWEIIRTCEGSDSGCEWMAIHIGMLNERVDNLTKLMRRMERKLKKKPRLPRPDRPGE